VILASLLQMAFGGVSIPWTPDSSGRTQFELWLDPYYSAVNATRALASEPIHRLDTDHEGGVYSWLMRRLPFPRDVLVEASVNPLPVAGWATRRFARSAYDAVEQDGFRPIQAVTTGFPEPWALSLFLGNVVNLVSSADSGKVHGVGYSGLLVSWGAWHLNGNRLVRDDWFETEVKLKGDDLQPRRKLGWSFRIGWREHLHPSIRDAVYLSVARKRTDFAVTEVDLLRNSSLEARVDLDRSSLPAPSPLRWTALVGKKFPSSSGAWAFSMSAGLERETRSAYDGDLRETAPKGWTLLLRPNVEW
jgi:hypothetical protein